MSGSAKASAQQGNMQRFEVSSLARYHSISTSLPLTRMKTWGLLGTMSLTLFCFAAVLLFRTARCQGWDLAKTQTDASCTAQPLGYNMHCSNAYDSRPSVWCPMHAGSYGPTESEVTAVPLWDAPLPSPQYAGYINIPGTSKHIFYHLFLSHQSPAKDPLVVRCVTYAPPLSQLMLLFNTISTTRMFHRTAALNNAPVPRAVSDFCSVPGGPGGSITDLDIVPFLYSNNFADPSSPSLIPDNVTVSPNPHTWAKVRHDMCNEWPYCSSLAVA